MPFSDPIIDGDERLIRDAIKSENYVPGTSGWIIKKDGFAEFLDVVIRGTLQSNNYSPGVAGWKLDQDGLAEFAEILINSFGLAGKITIQDGKLEIFNSSNELALGMGVDIASPFFGPYFAMYDVSTGVPRFIVSIASPSSYPKLKIIDAGGLGYLELDPGTGFGSGLRLQPVASGATTNPALVTATPSGTPGDVMLEIWSPENSQHAAGIRSLIQLYGGYQFRQSSKIEHHTERSEFFGDIVSIQMRRASAFEATQYTGIVNTAYGAISAPALEITKQATSSGNIDVHLAVRGSNSSAGVPFYTSFEVRENDVFGTVLRAAQDLDLQHQDCNGSRFGVTIPLSGLPAFGSGVTDYYVRMMHRVPSGTGTVSDRRLIVAPQW